MLFLRSKASQYFKISVQASLTFGSSQFWGSTVSNKEYFKNFSLYNFLKYSSPQLYSHETYVIRKEYSKLTNRWSLLYQTLQSDFILKCILQLIIVVLVQWMIRTIVDLKPEFLNLPPRRCQKTKTWTDIRYEWDAIFD